MNSSRSARGTSSPWMRTHHSAASWLARLRRSLASTGSHSQQFSIQFLPQLVVTLNHDPFDGSVGRAQARSDLGVAELLPELQLQHLTLSRRQRVQRPLDAVLHPLTRDALL